MALRILVLFILCQVLCTAQADRFNTTAQRWDWMTGTAGELRAAAASKNLRITDLEIISRSPIIYAAVLVDNSGINAVPWFFYTGLTLKKLNRATSRDTSRLTDLESYFRGRQPGAKQLHSAVGVTNVGPMFSKLWGFSINFEAKKVRQRLRKGVFKIVDIDTYTLFGRRFYNFLTVENAREDKAKSIVLLHKSAETIMKKAMKTKSRIVDIERHDDGLYTAVMEVMKPPVKWFWLRGIAGEDINSEAKARSARVYDLEPYQEGPLLKYDVLLIENKM